MEIKNLTIVAGSKACNAECPFCIAKTTPAYDLALEEPEFNWRKFKKAALLAERTGAVTALITGKGEPTLFPEQLSNILYELKEYKIPLIELQTNGIVFDKNYQKYKKYLNDWYENGLDLVSLSITHHDNEKNSEILGTKVSLEKIINRLHDHKLSVRITCLLMKDYIDSLEKVLEVVNFAKKLNVEQLSFRELGVSQHPQNESVYSWTKEHILPKKELIPIKKYFEENAQKLMTTEYGLTVYDYEGQNVAMTNCMTLDSESDNIRQLIFFPDGHIRYDWQFKGAIII